MVNDDTELTLFPQDKRFSTILFSDSVPRFAIPQITARTDGINENATKSDAAKAVQSIPAYVEACDLFLAFH